jgi:hypothetical protein
LEVVNFIRNGHPPWLQERLRIAEQEAKQAIKLLLGSSDPTSDLVIFTEESSHLEEGLGTAVVTTD